MNSKPSGRPSRSAPSRSARGCGRDLFVLSTRRSPRHAIYLDVRLVGAAALQLVTRHVSEVPAMPTCQGASLSRLRGAEAAVGVGVGAEAEEADAAGKTHCALTWTWAAAAAGSSSEKTLCAREAAWAAVAEAAWAAAGAGMSDACAALAPDVLASSAEMDACTLAPAFVAYTAAMETAAMDTAAIEPATCPVAAPAVAADTAVAEPPAAAALGTSLAPEIGGIAA